MRVHWSAIGQHRCVVSACARRVWSGGARVYSSASAACWLPCVPPGLGWPTRARFSSVAALVGSAGPVCLCEPAVPTAAPAAALHTQTARSRVRGVAARAPSRPPVPSWSPATPCRLCWWWRGGGVAASPSCRRLHATSVPYSGSAAGSRCHGLPCVCQTRASVWAPRAPPACLPDALRPGPPWHKCLPATFRSNLCVDETPPCMCLNE